MRTWQISCLICCGIWISAICASAMQPADASPLPVGEIGQIARNRDLPFTEAGLWLGSGAETWRGVKSAGPDISFGAAGKPFNISGEQAIQNAEEAQRIMTNFARGRSQYWGMLQGADFQPLQIRESRGIWHVTLIQTFRGVPIFGSRLEGMISKEGKLSALNARLYPLDQAELFFPLSPQGALSYLTDDPTAQIDFSRKVLYPMLEGQRYELRAAWQMRASTNRPDLRPAGIIEAGTGQVLFRYNDVAFDEVSGNILGLVLPAYWNDSPQTWAQKHQWVDLPDLEQTYTNISGHYAVSGLSPGQYPLFGKLLGLYVDVNNDDGPDALYADTASTGFALDWTWDYDLARQDEVNMYYHVDHVHDFFKGLEPEFTALDFPLPATVGYGTNYENAFWNGSGIYFGTGGGTFRNFALFCDVIYHEYGHGVTDMIYPDWMLPYSGQPGAMDEGWSDYFACTITNEPLIGEGGLYTNGGVMRNLDNTLRYPENWAGEVHADGRIFGGALWDLRERIGAALADSLIHFAKYDLAEYWEDYFVDVLVLDDDDGDLSNGGPHHEAIYESFGLHGIGPGVDPELIIYPTVVVENGTGGSVGNGDGFFDPGEVLSMTFSVTDQRYLYPPAASGVTVSVTSNDPDLELNPAIYNLGEISAGATVQAPESLMITVSGQAELRFAQIIFEITANDGSYQISDSVEIIVGHPPTLLVDDDGGAGFQQFFDSALRDWGQVFSSYEVAVQGAVANDFLHEFSVVIWLTGNESQSTLTLEDQAHLAEYLEAGNSLLLTGQNLVEDIGGSAFFADYLKAAPLAGAVNDLILDGVPGDAISDSQWVMIIGAGAGNNQTSPGAIAALPGAQEIFTYHSDPDHRPGAVRYAAGTYKTATFAFGLEAISGLAGSTPQAEVLSSVLAWFGLATGIEENQSKVLPAEFSLGQPYPNPFNAQISIPLELPEAAYARVELFNVQGQLLETIQEGMQEAGTQTIHFNAAHLASGIYLVKVQIQNNRGAERLMMISKVILLK